MLKTAFASIWLILSLFSLSPLIAEIRAAAAEHREFSQFSVDLPPEWDGEEQTGFVSDNPAEYALTLGRKDEKGDSFIAQISIYILPNKPGATAEAAARTLMESQADPTEPEKKGPLWVFEGEPRSNTVKGRGLTMVNADPEYLLVIIAQDPANSGANTLLESLRGITPEAQRLLGR